MSVLPSLCGNAATEDGSFICGSVALFGFSRRSARRGEQVHVRTGDGPRPQPGVWRFWSRRDLSRLGQGFNLGFPAPETVQVPKGRLKFNPTNIADRIPHGGSSAKPGTPPERSSGARQNSSGTPKHRSFDSSFPSLPSVGFSRDRRAKDSNRSKQRKRRVRPGPKRRKRINRTWDK